MTVRTVKLNPMATAPALNERQKDFEAYYDDTCSAAFGLALLITEDVSAAEVACEAAYLEHWRSHSWSAREPFSHCHLRLTEFVRQKALTFRPLARPGRSSSGREVLPPLPALRDPVHPIRAALHGLPESDRRVLALVSFGGLSVAEVARTLMTPVGEVRAGLRRAILALSAEIPV